MSNKILNLLEVLRLTARNTVPLLCSPKMVVVYGVEIVVLIVPTERTKLHADVQPRYVHSVDRCLLCYVRVIHSFIYSFVLTVPGT